MNKLELAGKVSKTLDRNGIRKFVHIEKRKLQITDVTYKDESVAGQVTVRAKDKMVKYTMDDVMNILDGIAAVVKDELSHGEPVNLYGLGKFGLKYRRPKRMWKPDTKEWIDVPEKYVAYVTPSVFLREAADIYTLSKQNNPEGFKMPDPIYDQFESPDEDEEVDE